MPKRKTSLEEFISRSNEVHNGKYDYSKVSYHNNRTPVEIICPIHGTFYQTPYGHIQKRYGCPKCSYYNKRKLIFGIGLNDLNINECNKTVYAIWKTILRRCYDKKYQKLKPTYKGCSVCEDWKLLSNFKNWYDKNHITGYHLDKDILKKGNKVYGPENCCFVPPEINNLFKHRISDKDEHITGISFSKYHRKYAARIGNKIIDGKKTLNLGYFDTAEDAFIAYKMAKEKQLKLIANKYFSEGLITKNVYNALMHYEVQSTD